MNKATELEAVIANLWANLALVLGEAREPFERELTKLLRQLEGAQGAEQEKASRAIFALFKKHENADRLLTEAIRSTGVSKGSIGPAGFITKERYTLIPVFYGTDRALAGNRDAVSYGPERGDLSYGVVEVSIPDDHRMGAIEKPRIWKLQFREDPQKHVVVHRVETMSAAEFAARAQGALEGAAKKEVLLFVHGFNVDFSEAAERAAQLAYDLHFEGLAALYSWPSEGSIPKYTIDEANVEWSLPRFAEFLRLVRENLGAEIVHIVAHSMGNRLVAPTIKDMNFRQVEQGARLRQIVFAAPDIDAGRFKDLAKAFHQKADRFTLYASSDDKAIKASRLIHKYARAGESGLDLVVVDSVDTVDATAVDTSLLGHSFYGDSRSVLSDLFDLIRRGTPPQERFGLDPRKKYGAHYWLFKP